MTAELEDCHKYLEDTTANVLKIPRENQCVDIPQYIGVTLVNHVGRKAEEILDSLFTVLNENIKIK